jgi:hypothetical protein
VFLGFAGLVGARAAAIATSSSARELLISFAAASNSVGPVP